MSARCICPKVRVGNATVPDPVDVHCPEHGFPEDIWYAGHPLRRHALTVDIKTGEVMTPQEARRRVTQATPPGWDKDREDRLFDLRFRTEWPSETYARLLQER